ncbi:MAG: ABC transporter permease [Myxococcaceae bacterium]
MRSVLLVARRELSAYLHTMTGYVIFASLLFLNALAFNVFAMGTLNKQSAKVVADFFYFTSGFTIVVAIFISMRLLAEERQAGTLPLLYSSPIKDSEIILGKYLSAIAFLAIYLLCTVFMPLLIMINGKISYGQIFAGYLGLLLLGSASLGIGTLGSALAKNQLLAVILSAVMAVTLLVTWMLASVTERPLSEFFSSLSLWQQHFPPFQSGIVHLRDVVYYAAITYVGLFGATRVLEARRWR